MFVLGEEPAMRRQHSNAHSLAGVAGAAPLKRGGIPNARRLICTEADLSRMPCGACHVVPWCAWLHVCDERACESWPALPARASAPRRADARPVGREADFAAGKEVAQAVPRGNHVCACERARAPPNDPTAMPGHQRAVPCVSRAQCAWSIRVRACRDASDGACPVFDHRRAPMRVYTTAQQPARLTLGSENVRCLHRY